MFFREYKQKNQKTGEYKSYYALVSTVRMGTDTEQVVELPLGASFDLEKRLWPAVAHRVEAILANQERLFPLPDEVENPASELAMRICERRAKPPVARAESTRKDDELKIQFGKQLSAGLAHAALLAMDNLGFQEAFVESGLDPLQASIIMALVAARMENPGSEQKTYKWLRKHSSLLDLLNIRMYIGSHMRLHRATDTLYSCILRIENSMKVFKTSLLDGENVLFLYDLTNTYFEGSPDTELAKRGHSKEKRKDCLLISLAVAVDSNSYIKAFKVYPGNVSEASTLKEMIKILKPLDNTIIIMDKGIATAENIEWLYAKGYKYLVASRERTRVFDHGKIKERFKTKSGQEISAYLENKKIKKGEIQIEELRCHCYSTGQAFRDEEIMQKKRAGFEQGLNELDNQLRKVTNSITYGTAMKKIGALGKTYPVSSHYNVQVTCDDVDSGNNDPIARTVNFEYKPVENSKATEPGVYVLRTNVETFKTGQEVWETYTRQTEIESVFASLKSDLGLRPVYHSTERRILTHFFITILGYQCINWIRKRLKTEGINSSWETIADKLRSITLNEIKIVKKGKEMSKSCSKEIDEDALRYLDILGIKDVFNSTFTI
jgi:transposase